MNLSTDISITPCALVPVYMSSHLLCTHASSFDHPVYIFTSISFASEAAFSCCWSLLMSARVPVSHGSHANWMRWISLEVAGGSCDIYALQPSCSFVLSVYCSKHSMALRRGFALIIAHAPQRARSSRCMCTQVCMLTCKCVRALTHRYVDVWVLEHEILSWKQRQTSM